MSGKKPDDPTELTQIVMSGKDADAMAQKAMTDGKISLVLFHMPDDTYFAHFLAEPDANLEDALQGALASVRLYRRGH